MGQIHRKPTPDISLSPKSSVGGGIGADQGDRGKAFVAAIQMGRTPSQQRMEAVGCVGMSVIPWCVSV
jgi:hypothetical protein